MTKVEKVPVMMESKPVAPSTAMQAWRPFEGLRREVDRLFEDFTMSPFMMPFRRPAFDLEPFWQPDSWIAAPAMDLVEHEKAFELTAELPGLDEKDVEVKVAHGVLTIKGEKAEDKEEKAKGFHMRERRFGAFERALRIPDMVEMEKIEATFKKGVLMVKMPKTAEAQKPVKKIAVKGE
jgi:HSP20 family protein